MYILRIECTDRYAVVVVLGVLMGLASVAWSQPRDDRPQRPPGGQPPADQGPQIEIVCRFVDFAPEAFPAKEIVTARSPITRLAKAQSEGKAEVRWAVHVLCASNQWAEVRFHTGIPVVITEYDEHGQRIPSETDERDVKDFLRVKPVLLEDGEIAMDLQVHFTTSANSVTGPEGQIVPIVVTQVIRTSVIVPDQKRVTIRCGRLGELLWPFPAEAEAGVEREPRETLVMITPKVVKPQPQTPGKPDATKETQKTEQ